RFSRDWSSDVCSSDLDVTALKSHLVFDDATVESQLAIAKDNIDTLNTFGRIVPIVLGILGVIALIAGILLGIRGGSAPAPASAEIGRASCRERVWLAG